MVTQLPKSLKTIFAVSLALFLITTLCTPLHVVAEDAFQPAEFEDSESIIPESELDESESVIEEPELEESEPIIEDHELEESESIIEDTELEESETLIALSDPNFEGDGTSVSPYLISNQAYLARFATLVNDDVAGTYDGAYFKLTTNIELSSSGAGFDATEGWTPIGSNDRQFKGHFDGAGHTISGLWIYSASLKHVGLFGYVKPGGSISNLSVVLGDDGISSSFVSNPTGAYAGGLVGTNNGEIKNCSVSGSKVASMYTSGGLVGNNYLGLITDSYATVDNVSAYSTGSANCYAGGLVGYNSTDSTITKSYATGSIVSSNTKSNAYAGGLAGFNASTITDCYATGSDVSATSVPSVNDNNAFAGGLVGLSCGPITNCYVAVKNLSASGDNDAYTGGLVGKNDDVKGGEIANCFFDIDTISGTLQGVGYGPDLGVTGKTTLDMQTQSTFVGWDFSNIWSIHSKVNEGYPSLYTLQKVSYDHNGGSGDVPVDSNTYYQGDTVLVSFDPLPTRESYNFLGWARDKNATVPEYSKDGTTSFIISDKDVTLYAVWQIWPAFDSGFINDIRVTTSEGVLPDGSKLVVEINSESNPNLDTKHKNTAERLKNHKIYMLDVDENQIQPATGKTYKMYVMPPAGWDLPDLEMIKVLVGEDHVLKRLPDEIIDGKTVAVFENDSFSDYTLIDKLNDDDDPKSPDDDDSKSPGDAKSKSPGTGDYTQNLIVGYVVMALLAAGVLLLIIKSANWKES